MTNGVRVYCGVLVSIAALFQRLRMVSRQGVRQDISLGNPASASYVGSLGDRLYRASLARALIREVGSLIGRIKVVLVVRSHRRVIHSPSPQSMDLTLKEREQFQCSRTEDMNKLFAVRPWLTHLDAELFCRAWKLGAEWSGRILSTKDPLRGHASSAILPQGRQFYSAPSNSARPQT